MNLEKFTSISAREIEAIKLALPTLTTKEKLELLEDLDVREKRATLAAANHKKLAKIFTDVIEGKKKRVIINIAPRMGKSEFSSYLFPAYFLGAYPEKKIIMGTHTASLSEDFGRRIRN